MASEDSRELNSASSAEHLNYTLASFYKIRHKIPHRKERGRLYFKVSDLDEFRASQSVKYVPGEVA